MENCCGLVEACCGIRGMKYFWGEKTLIFKNNPLHTVDYLSITAQLIMFYSRHIHFVSYLDRSSVKSQPPVPPARPGPGPGPPLPAMGRPSVSLTQQYCLCLSYFL